MQIVERGLILRETPYKEADIMLSVLTECNGKISVLARGARRKSSKFSAAVQLLAYSEFTLYESAGRYTINEAEPIELFYGIREDIVKLSLASYFAEVLEQAADEDCIDPELLRLGLNSLYAIAKTEIAHEKIKAVFELKIAQLAGYAPNLFSCVSCGEGDAFSSFDIRNGSLLCSKCDPGYHPKVDASVVDAMRYILGEDIKKIFSFSINDASMKLLSKLTDEYLRVHFDRNFKTNTFYKTLF
ncbi:MAG: DNA repair protein RecO [Oscillospiraceae bacterium]|nr:DNA repair protein RecO [Oscillospiraceae bacterium]